MHRSLVRLATGYGFAITLFITLTGCGTQSSSAIGEAYVAPASTNLRRDLTEKNSTAAVLKHGDRVSILDVRRRFVKIRTAGGIEGWIDSAQLLSSAQMDQIRRERQQALALPSEGSATAFEALNIHIEPNRRSPALARIPESGSVAVLAHKPQPKTAGPAPALVFERPQSATRRQRKDKQSKSIYHLPPKPPAPKPPYNWQELSSERIGGSSSTAEMKIDREEPKQKTDNKAEDPNKPVILEDWSLVRTKENQIGWVLTRNLIMSIPDEVAQYAEGKHITSYFDLGAVDDEVKGTKHNWLWTTSSAAAPYDFDAWRVFLWNRRRHRYETSYRQRNIEGYFPVHVDPPGSNTSERSFQVITKDEDGKLWRCSYVFDGVRVRLTGNDEYDPRASANADTVGGLNMDQLHAKLPDQGWFHRHWNALKRKAGPTH
ncbi:MAG: SH3 domain-containing protein [Bryobacteraceae bacterium]